MKKILFLALCGALMAGCAKKAVEQTPYEKFAQLTEQVEENYQNAASQEEEEHIVNIYVDESLKMIVDNPETSDAYKIAKELLYLLDIDQKEQVFNMLTNMDSLEAYGLDRKYEAFFKEKNTCVGKEYTDFETTMPDGQKIRVSDLLKDNEYVLIDFWASWCRPCCEFMPELKSLYEDEKGKLEILGVSLDNDRDKWLGAIEKMELNWKHGSDLKGWQDDNAELYGVNAIPCIVLIRASDGMIVARNEHNIAKLKAIISL